MIEIRNLQLAYDNPEVVKDAYELQIRATQKDYCYRLYTQDENTSLTGMTRTWFSTLTMFDYDRITGQNSKTLVMQEQDKGESMLSEENESGPSEEMTEP